MLTQDMKKSKGFSLSTSQIILLGFFIVILVGSLLLALPFSSADGKPVAYLDALFTATTSTCVTGLVTLPTVSAWSTFGHAVILVLIQIGGLGVVTMITGAMLMLRRKMGIGTRMLIQDAFNLNTLSGLIRFVKKVFAGSLLVEGIGAVLYLPVFVRDFGLKGIWMAVFNSVSAFCNAGLDIISEHSLYDYVSDPLVNVVTCCLIVLGGIGYIVWWDVLRVIELKKHKKVSLLKSLSLQSKIVMATTLILIVSGGVLIALFEWNGTAFAGLSSGHKIMAAFFQSVTTRTAGFATVPQENLSEGSAVVSILLMFIGGSPSGTAGGIKTVTVAVLLSTALSVVLNRDDVNLFNRKIGEQAIRKAVAVLFTSFAIAFISTLLLSFVMEAQTIDIVFESVSATATVGLTRNLTPSLNGLGKCIIVATMFFGRVGPISLAFALKGKTRNTNIIKNPAEDISIG